MAEKREISGESVGLLDPEAAIVRLESELRLLGVPASQRIHVVVQEHSPTTVTLPHYHQSHEALYVERGRMTFWDLTNRAKDPVEFGPRSLGRVPEGTVHRVQISEEGVKYLMAVSEPYDDRAFAVSICPDLVDLLEVNYRIAEVENEESSQERRAFFERHLSERLVFVDKDGSVKGKAHFEQTTHLNRVSRRVSLQQVGNVVVATLVVETHVAEQEGRFYNCRVFEREGKVGDVWRCVRWMNADTAGHA